MKRFTFFCFQYTKLTCNAKITKLFRNIEKRNTQFDNQNLKEYFFLMFSFIETCIAFSTEKCYKSMQ